MQGLGDAIGQMMNTMLILLCIAVPLAIWKLIELIVWIFHQF